MEVLIQVVQTEDPPAGGDEDPLCGIMQAEDPLAGGDEITRAKLFGIV
jgi:hypothetical protein